MGQANIDPKKYIYVLGIEPVNQRRLNVIASQSDFVFVPLLTYDELRGRDALSSAETLEKIERIYQMEGPFIDGIMGYWDFPINILVPVLAQKYGWPAANPLSVIRAEHKLMCRKAVESFAPELNPKFQGYHMDPVDERTLDFPFWIKPPLGYLGQLVYYVRDQDEYRDALETIKDNIDRFAEPFAELVSAAGLNFGKDIYDGYALVFEENLAGHQCTVEGYVFQGTTNVISIIDNKKDLGLPSLTRHQYPSSLPDTIQDRLERATGKVIEALEYRRGCFNVEFIWNEESDEIKLLEINTRSSQSNADIVNLVDGCPNLRMAADIAIDRPPRVAYRRGIYNVAAKFMWRSKADAMVERVPTPQELATIKQGFPHIEVEIKVRRGDRLSQLINQDTFSYVLAEAHIGAFSESELLERYDNFINLLKEKLVLRTPDAQVQNIDSRKGVVRELFP